MKVKIFFLFCASLLLLQANFAQPILLDLKATWQFKQVGTKQWYKAIVPGTVHTDLLQNKLIQDPFYRDNETKLQWISKVDWEYKASFDVDESILTKKKITLIFEGLDTYAELYLNGKKLLSTNNMFRTWKVEIKTKLLHKNNKLYIKFLSAEKIADSLASITTVKYPSENNRNFVRKAQYHFGWDFAPKLTTCGVWRKVKIEAKDDLKSTLPINRKANPSPIVNLIQQKDSIGQSFYFTVNGKPTFIKGANWVPADVFLPRVTKNKYRKLLIAAKSAGINMLRVWGGGVYEDEAFYDLCDSLQIMVWQDFMFAGAMYPADESYLENIKEEAIDNIKRLTQHPCIVLWCGNNEIDEAWHNWGWQKQFTISKGDSTKLWFDYKKIFHELLPELVKIYSTKPYITTSPLNGWGKKESMTQGDSHYWGVWWGLEPIEKYKEKVPRFMSEYGMQSLPNFKSIQQFTLPQDLDTSSKVMKLHQKHATGYQNIATYLKQNNIIATNFEEYIKATQSLQAKALEVAITAHINAQPSCMGTMFWQLNDCYPGTTWSIIDYYGRKKKAYYVVKKLYNTKE